MVNFLRTFCKTTSSPKRRPNYIQVSQGPEKNDSSKCCGKCGRKEFQRKKKKIDLGAENNIYDVLEQKSDMKFDMKSPLALLKRAKINATIETNPSDQYVNDNLFKADKTVTLRPSRPEPDTKRPMKIESYRKSSQNANDQPRAKTIAGSVQNHVTSPSHVKTIITRQDSRPVTQPPPKAPRAPAARPKTACENNINHSSKSQRQIKSRDKAKTLDLKTAPVGSGLPKKPKKRENGAVTHDYQNVKLRTCSGSKDRRKKR